MSLATVALKQLLRLLGRGKDSTFTPAPEPQLRQFGRVAPLSEPEVLQRRWMPVVLHWAVRVWGAAVQTAVGSAEGGVLTDLLAQVHLVRHLRGAVVSGRGRLLKMLRRRHSTVTVPRTLR